VHDAITTCKDNDGICPSTCNYKNDDDCPDETKDCKEDLSCFSDALGDCLLATGTLAADNSTSDVEMEITTSMEIRGDTSNDRCKVRFKTEDVKMSFTDDHRAELEDDGYTDDEIDNMEDDAQDVASDVEGNTWTCNFEDTDDLVDILNDWDDGDYDIGDFEDFDCTGDYFS
jgi:hypothetical protein